MPYMFDLKKIPLALSMALGSLAMAAPVTYGNITLDAEYALNGGPVVDGMSTAAIYALNGAGYFGQTAQGADLYLSATQGPSDVFFHTYGFVGSNTFFGARASGYGDFWAKTSSSYSNTIVNTSNADQAVNFTFNVDWGSVYINGSDDAMAELLLRVRVNGTDVARSFTSLTQSNGVLTCSESDMGSLGSYMDCDAGSSFLSSRAGLYTVSLGTLAAGSQFTLDYDIVSIASGDFATVNQCIGYGDGTVGRVGNEDVAQLMAVLDDGAINDDGNPNDSLPYCDPNFGGSGANSGDPFEPFTFANDFQVSFSNAVPEPGSLALLGLGVAGLAAARRRQRKITP